MSTPSTVAAPAPPVSWRHALQRLDNRLLPPILITCILITAHLNFGILEAYERTALAILTAIATELILGRITYGTWLHPASAYISGISVGILVRSPFLWPYVFASFISILSKYVLRLKGRHLWNPSNLGVSAVLFLAPQTVSLLSIQWGNNLWPMAVIWSQYLPISDHGVSAAARIPRPATSVAASGANRFTAWPAELRALPRRRRRLGCASRWCPVARRWSAYG